MEISKEAVLAAAQEDGVLAVILNDICESSTKSQLEMGKIFLKTLLERKQQQIESQKEAA